MPATPIARRKKLKNKQDRPIRSPATNRTEMTAVERAFAVGALTAIRGDYASQHDLATTMGRQQSGLSELLQRVEAKANNHTVALWDETLFKNDLGRGRSRLLTLDQKKAIINIATASRNAREKQSWQAIADDDFREVAPKMSITTFEKVMYEAGYARRRPEPHLTLEQERRRYAWALAHDPELREK